ncbi:MAG: endolytic transglycosylase MltG [Bacteroidetes bacterium]|nr:endolytic transglycosylase MltG [Bacteroidota bacterium]MBL6964574.1 endolytic transglycosylase MltG [Bacteroidota bacterium]
MPRRKKRKSTFSAVLIVFIILAFIVLLVGYKFYLGIFSPNLNPDYVTEHSVIEIPTESSYEDVLKLLRKDSILLDFRSFKWVAKKMNYPNHVYGGRYPVNREMNNYDLIRMLRAGENAPFMVTIDKHRTIYDLAGGVSAQLEIDSAEIVEHILNKRFLEKHKLNQDNVLSFFVPNTYEFYWNISLKKFFQRMQKEGDKYWTEEKIEKASNLRFTKAELYTLASIVQEEAAHESELERIAGVYLNRIRKNMPLQADPTIKYLIKDRNDQKLYLNDYEIVSPYNTYKNSGLPPGPITMARMSAMDAVLNAERHDFLYFCAKADGSGFHEFSTNYRQHTNYRNLYLRSKKN